MRVRSLVLVGSALAALADPARPVAQEHAWGNPRARSRFGAGRAAQLAGDRAAAAKAYREVLKAMERGDGTRSEHATARAFLPS